TRSCSAVARPVVRGVTARVSPIAFIFFFFQAEDGIRDRNVTGVQTCALPISPAGRPVPLLAIRAGADGLPVEVGRMVLAAACAEIGRASCRGRVSIWVGA